jgi:hypothetical protein
MHEKNCGGLFLLIFLLFFVPKAYSFDVSITETELGFGIYPEYNLGFHFCWGISSFGSIELNNTTTMGAGISTGQTGSAFNINAYTDIEYTFSSLGPYVPLYIGARYLFNGLVEYETGVHTLLPLLSLRWRWFDVSLGATLRFTIFDFDFALFEKIFAYSIHMNFYNTETARIGFGLTNFGRFAAENPYVYSFFLDNKFHITERISISTEVKMILSGNVGELTSVYGTTLKEEVLFTW